MKKKMWILAIAMLVVIPAMAGIVSASGAQSVESHHMEKGHHGMMGSFEYENGKVTGRYVNFTVNSKTGEIYNYSVNNTTVFTSITYQNHGIGKVRVSGAKFMYVGVWGNINWNWSKKNMTVNGGWRFVQAIDNPVGLLDIVVHGQDNVTYALPQGVNATLHNSVVMINGKVTGYLIVSNGEIAIKNNKIVVTTGIEEMKNNQTKMEKHHRTTNILFIEPEYWNVPKEIKPLMMKGLENNRIGGEMYIGPHGAEFVNYTYGMQAKLMLKERNHIRMEISGNGIEGGKVVVINIENNTFNYTNQHQLKVMLDGKEIKESSPNDVMNGGTEAKYAVEEQNGILTLLVYIPHFSEHTLDVESEASSSSENPINTMAENPLLLGIGVLILIVIVGAIIWKVKSR